MRMTGRALRRACGRAIARDRGRTVSVLFGKFPDDFADAGAGVAHLVPNRIRLGAACIRDIRGVCAERVGVAAMRDGIIGGHGIWAGSLVDASGGAFVVGGDSLADRLALAVVARTGVHLSHVELELGAALSGGAGERSLIGVLERKRTARCRGRMRRVTLYRGCVCSVRRDQALHRAVTNGLL